MKKDFKEIVQAMSAKEIIMAMVNGLKNPYTEIDMSTFGHESYEGVCFGCAATNTICSILGERPSLPYYSTGVQGLSRASISKDRRFVENFECAIDCLRQGRIDGYHFYAEIHGFARIYEEVGVNPLPCLSNEYTEADLLPYIELADSQPTNP